MFLEFVQKKKGTALDFCSRLFSIYLSFLILHLISVEMNQLIFMQMIWDWITEIREGPERQKRFEAIEMCRELARQILSYVGKRTGSECLIDFWICLTRFGVGLYRAENLGGGCPLDFLPDDISENGIAYARTPSSLWRLNEIPDVLLFHEEINMAYGFLSEWQDMCNLSKYQSSRAFLLELMLLLEDCASATYHSYQCRRKRSRDMGFEHSD